MKLYDNRYLLRKAYGIIENKGAEMKTERWILPKINRRDLFCLADLWDTTPLMTQFLVNRKIQELTEVERFFSEDSAGFSKIEEWDGLAKGVERIQQGIEKKEKICIYGDYDVDGIVGTAILMELFKRLGYPIEYYIPDRQEEGYGLNDGALAHLLGQGVTLLITVDCGTSSAELIQKYQSQGMDIIVTDHHLPGETFPAPFSLINPHFNSKPVGSLAGGAVAYKLAEGIWRTRSNDLTGIEDLLGWAALATVADMVPLVDENRLIVKRGLKELRKSRSVGFNALAEVAGLKLPLISERDLGFSIGPRLNASGRLQNATLGVKLFLCTDKLEAREIAEELNQINQERQQVEKVISEEARAQVRNLPELPSGLVLHSSDWHPGVVGIVASRIAREFWRPTLLLCGGEEEIKGSGRSIPALDLHGVLSSTREWLAKFGGHRQAAGLALKKENLSAFREMFQREIAERLSETDLIPSREADGVIQLGEISDSLLDQIASLAPFGMANSAPKFIFPFLTLQGIRKIGAEGKHLKLVLGDGVRTIEGVLWNRGEDFSQFMIGHFIHGFGEIKKNVWNGKETFEITLDQVGLAELPIEEKVLCPQVNDDARQESFSVERQKFAEFYRLLTEEGRRSDYLVVEFIGALWRKKNSSATWQEVDFFLQVFEELQFIERITEELICYKGAHQKKTTLEHSATYQEQVEKAGKNCE